MVALFVGLGIWQLQRRVEKHALIAALTERLAAPPGSLPSPSQWNTLTPARDEFRRVSFVATYQPPAGCDGLQFRLGRARRYFRSRHLGLHAGAAADRRDRRDQCRLRAEHDAGSRPARIARWRGSITNEPVTLTGYIRFPEAAGALTPPENLAKRLWFTRDHLAMARALGWGEDGKPVAPFYIDLEQPVPVERHPETRPARGPSQGRSPAIRHHLVRPGGRGGDRVRGVAAWATANRSPLATTGIRNF